MKITEQTQDDVRNVCRHWFKYTLPTLRDLEGYVDDGHNADLLIGFINYRCNGDYTLENLTAAAEHYKNNLHGVGVAMSPAQKLEKEKVAVQKKQDEINAKAKAANDKVIADWIK